MSVISSVFFLLEVCNKEEYRRYSRHGLFRIYLRHYHYYVRENGALYKIPKLSSTIVICEALYFQIASHYEFMLDSDSSDESDSPAKNRLSSPTLFNLSPGHRLRLKPVSKGLTHPEETPEPASRGLTHSVGPHESQPDQQQQNISDPKSSNRAEDSKPVRFLIY